MFADKLVNITGITSIYVSEVNEVCVSPKTIFIEKKSTKMLLHYYILYCKLFNCITKARLLFVYKTVITLPNFVSEWSLD